jgi:tripartite-type tricarboxylate transporter receptor subunit TctC
MRRALRVLVASAATLALAAASAAFGQGYPSKPIRLIAETAAGGPPDAVVRGLADRHAKVLGQPVLVENRSGGQGVVSALALLQSPADGYTVLQMGSPAAMVTPILSSKPAFDVLRDFAPLAQIGVSKPALAVHPSITANSVAELLDQARAQPGKIVWGTAGAASTAYLLMEWLRHSRGIHFYEVPYKSPPAAMQGLLSGDVQAVIFAVGPAMSHAKAGRLKVLGINADEPSQLFPELPLLKSGGIDIVPPSWFGLFMRAGTPPEMVTALNRAIAKVYQEPDFVASVLHRVGYEATVVTAAPPEAFAKFIKDDYDFHLRVKREAKLKNMD